MRLLLLLRHGKSDWDAAFANDHERPLAPRGRRAAHRMGDWLRRIELAPDAVLSSTAVRARTTAEIAAGAGGFPEPTLDRVVYEGGVDAVLALLRRRGGDSQRLLLVGHQPVGSQLLAHLVGGGDFCFPTAALACVEIPTDGWERVAGGCGRLRWLVTPRLLAAAGLIG